MAKMASVREVDSVVYGLTHKHSRVTVYLSLFRMRSSDL